MPDTKIDIAELIASGRAAWKRFFYPTNADFVPGNGGKLDSSVHLGLADNLRLALDALEQSQREVERLNKILLQVEANTRAINEAGCLVAQERDNLACKEAGDLKFISTLNDENDVLQARVAELTAEVEEANRRNQEVRVEHDGLRRSEREWRTKLVASQALVARLRGALEASGKAFGDIAFLRPGGLCRNKLVEQMERIAINAREDVRQALQEGE